MKTICSSLIAALLIASLAFTAVMGQAPAVSADPFQQRVPGITLGNQMLLTVPPCSARTSGLEFPLSTSSEVRYLTGPLKPEFLIRLLERVPSRKSSTDSAPSTNRLRGQNLEI